MTSRSVVIRRRICGMLYRTIFLAAIGVIGQPHEGHADARMSAIDRLVAEDEIRQKISAYGLFADGDGESTRDFPALFNEIFSPETTVQGRKTTREDLTTKSEAQTFDPTLEARHLLLSTHFDEITPLTAKTRTTTLYLKVTKNMIGADCKKSGEDACGGRVVHASMFVYHDVWRKTPDGWRKTDTKELH